MIIQDFVNKGLSNGTLSRMSTKARSTYYYRLSNKSIERVVTAISDFFEPHEWKVKRTHKTKHRFVARKPKSHIKINFSLDGNHYSASGYSKSELGGWVEERYSYNGNLPLLMKELSLLNPRKLIAKDSLPNPFTFTDDKSSVRVNTGCGNTVVARWHVNITACECEGAVALEEDGTVTKKLIAKPDEEVWFYLSCISPAGNSFKIITDGEVYYPVKAKGKPRVYSNVDYRLNFLKKLSSLDKELIELAVTHYLRPK